MAENERTIVRVNGTRLEAGNTSTWEELVATFISYLDVKKSSRDSYTRNLTQFFYWLTAEGRELGNLTRVDILEYKDHLFSIGLSSLTISNYIVAVRKFFAWAESMKLYPDIAKGINTPKRREKKFKKEHLTIEKSKALLEFFETKSLRDFAIVNLLIRTGLRTIEVARADVGDITYKCGRRIIKVWGKGRTEKDDFVVLSDKAYSPIKEYLATRKKARLNDPLFACESNNNSNGRLTTRSISRICREGLDAIGLDSREFTAHSLRHTTAVTILEQTGYNIHRTQTALRHASPLTTQTYLESAKENENRFKNAPELVIDDVL